MARAYFKASNDDKLWVERDNDDYASDLRFLFHTENGVVASSTLGTHEIGRVIAHLSNVYFRRTHKIIWPMDPALAAEFEKVLVEAKEVLDAWVANSPGQQAVHAAYAAKEKTSECVLCDGECSGDCLI